MFDVVNLKIDAPAEWERNEKGRDAARNNNQTGAWYGLVKKCILISYKYLQHSHLDENLFAQH